MSSSSAGWAQTDSPMRIAILGWAWLSAQGSEGSGYNLNASELARGLSRSGHAVFYLQSGVNRRVWPRGAHIREREVWSGVRCYDLRNAPNLAPAAWNFRNMVAEIESPETTRLVLGWLDAVGAEVVHIHSLEGYGLDLIGAIRGSGRPVVVTPHNYWYACPQVDLLHNERRVCVDYEGGKRCETCIEPPGDPDRHKSKRAMGQTLEYLINPFWADVVRKSVYGLPAAVRNALRGRLLARWSPQPLNRGSFRDEDALGFDAGAGPVASGRVDADRFPAYDAAGLDTNDRVLEQAGRERAERASVNGSLPVLNNVYARRRWAGVESLSRASLVTPPSDFVRRVYVSLGVPEERTRWVKLGQPHFDRLHRASKRLSGYDKPAWSASEDRPLRLGFFGTTRANKGLMVLADAIELMDERVRSRCHFVIRAGGDDGAYRERLARFPGVSVWGGYHVDQLPGAIGEYDVGVLAHVWLENSPLVMLEHLHAGRMVVCPKLGGCIDFLEEDRTCVWFRGGDPAGLAEAVRRIVDGEVVVPSRREVHERSMGVLRSYPGHVAEVEGMYREVLGREVVGAGGAGSSVEGKAGDESRVEV